MPKIKIFRQKNHSSLGVIAKAERNSSRVITSKDIEKRIKLINKEFKRGFKLLMHHPDTVTFFGSARFDENNKYYKMARGLARKVVEEIGSTVVTGGGGGIMEAASRGADDAKGESVGMTIRLPHEQATNRYVKYSADFYYFFSRKVALSFTARAYIYFPGGFGTLDEFFEILTLKQTEKIDYLPIVLIGTEYWAPLLEYIDSVVLKYDAISPEDEKLYHLTDDLDEVITIISKPLNRKNL